MKQGTEITTWEDVCEVLNMNPITSLLFVEMLPEEDKKYMAAIYKLTKATKAVGGTEDPTDYYPVFDTDDDDDPSGLGFSSTTYDGWYTGTHVGARLTVPTPEMAKHMGKTFLEWYRDFMIVPKKTEEQ